MARNGIKVMTIWGIDIIIDYSWIFIFVLITWVLSAQYYPRILENKDLRIYMLLGIVTSLLFFASALTHELFHSIVAQKNGIKVKRIVLFLFGGVSELFSEPKQPEAEFKIAIAGPVTSLILALIFAFLAWLFKTNQYFNIFFFTLFQLNIILFIFNILPGFPLDGGRILRSIVWAETKNYEKSTMVASISGKILASALIVLGALQIVSSGFWGGIWLVLMGFFLYQSAGQEYLELKIKKELENIPIKAIYTKNIAIINPALSIKEAEDDYFKNNHTVSYVVSDSNTVYGVISLEDIDRLPRSTREIARILDVMKPIPRGLSIKSSEKVLKALKIMIENEIGIIPVKDDGNLRGILTLDNIASYLQTRNII